MEILSFGVIKLLNLKSYSGMAVNYHGNVSITLAADKTISNTAVIYSHIKP